MSDIEIRYTRPKPEEWDTLVEAMAPEDIQFERPATMEQAKHAVGIASELETERLEVNTYYGLGLGMRGLARALQDNERRAALAETAADSLTAANVRMTTAIQNPGPLAFNTVTMAMFQQLRELGKETYLDLPVGDHLVADALTVAMRARRSNLAFSSLTDDWHQMQTSKVVTGLASADLIIPNATAGSIIVHHHLRAAQAIATEQAPKAQNPVRFAVQSAGLHTEEFQGPLYQELVTYNPDGTVQLDRSKLPETPQLPEQRITDIKRLGRLGCPAIQVQYAIPGMLELMLDIERAQEN